MSDILVVSESEMWWCENCHHEIPAKEVCAEADGCLTVSARKFHWNGYDTCGPVIVKAAEEKK